MKYNAEIIKKENYKVSDWSGGKTVEMLIYPETAEYSKRNFDFRISAATVDLEESVFTRLPGIKRQLIVTDGKTVLEHKYKYSIALNPFEKDTFMGDWHTKSRGKASDFNLMTAENCDGDLEIIYFNCKNEVGIELCSHKETERKIFEYFYCIGGKVQFMIDDDNLYVDEKDMLCISYISDENYIKLKALKEDGADVKIIHTVIKWLTH